MKLSFALLGHPVGHSVSPAIHQAAYDALALPHDYRALDVPDRSALEAVVAELAAGRLAGANVTIPWKREVLDLVERVDPSAAGVGAANVLALRDEHVVAYNTDVPALAAELRAMTRARPRALVVGDGGGALGAIAALRSLDAERVTVVARRHQGPSDEWSRAALRSLQGARALAWPASGVLDVGDVADVDVVVQATSDGMHGASDGHTVANLVPWAALPVTAAAYDLVYRPAITPFLRAARAARLATEGGLGMLVGQAALAFKLWLGVTPDVGVMRAAALAALERVPA